MLKYSAAQTLKVVSFCTLGKNGCHTATAWEVLWWDSSLVTLIAVKILGWSALCHVEGIGMCCTSEQD